MDNLDQIIIVLKNWLYDPYLNCSQHKDLTNFLKFEFSLANDIYDLIEESNYFEQLELDNDEFAKVNSNFVFIVFLGVQNLNDNLHFKELTMDELNMVLFLHVVALVFALYSRWSFRSMKGFCLPQKVFNKQLVFLSKGVFTCLL
jgi:hypothetical protein